MRLPETWDLSGFIISDYILLSLAFVGPKNVSDPHQYFFLTASSAQAEYSTAFVFSTLCITVSHKTRYKKPNLKWQNLLLDNNMKSAKVQTRWEVSEMNKDVAKI